MPTTDDPGLVDALVHPRDLLKPRMRGVLHQWAAIVGLVCAIVLCALVDTRSALVATGVYGLSITALFGTSATYHRITWRTAEARQRMKRLDHSMIFVLIAGTYTPFVSLLLEGTKRTVVLWVVWGGALLGIVLRMAWLSSPRFLVIPLYLGLGWVAAFFVPELLHRAGVAAFVLIAVGGLAYSLGAVAYAARRPDPWPAVFGYHEVFHACTVVAAVCHYVAVYFALHSVGAL